MKPDVRPFRNEYELSHDLAAAVVRTINQSIERKGKCSLVLSGGDPPRHLHRLLASRHRTEIPWEHVHVFWGDERYVPQDDARSNYRMARETLLDHVPCPEANIHPMPTHLPDPDDAARDYEATLRNYFVDDPAHFDLVLLGFGSDGHTASLFPGSVALDEKVRRVVAVTTTAEPPVRLTLTLPALNQSENVYFLVIGPHKAYALDKVLSGTADHKTCPAAGVRLNQGAAVWWIERVQGAF